jgi:hypothetical protein
MWVDLARVSADWSLTGDGSDEYRVVMEWIEKSTATLDLFAGRDWVGAEGV